MDANYRFLDTWCFFSNADLKSWSDIYKTSWFRVATAVIGLVTAGISTPIPHHDHALMVAFGARPKEFASWISHMANTMPVKFPLSSLLRNDSTFADAVKTFSKNLSGAKKHELFPFLALIEEAQKTIENDLLTFKVVVTFSPKLAEKPCKLYPVEGVSDLFFCFLEQDDGVSLGSTDYGKGHCHPTVFDTNTISRLKQQFLETIAISQSQADIPLTRLKSFQGCELAHLVSGPDIHDVVGISCSRVHEWIRPRAAIQPHAIALSSAEQDQQMTYMKMTKRGSQITHFLQQSGIKVGDTIILHMDRSFKILLWILGTLEVGACYVVVDTSWPALRREAICKISEAKMFVTDSGRLETQASSDLPAIEIINAEADLPWLFATVLSMQLADGIARVNFGYSTVGFMESNPNSGNESGWSRDLDDVNVGDWSGAPEGYYNHAHYEELSRSSNASQHTEVFWEVQRFGYGWGFCSNETVLLSLGVAILLIHAVMAIAHIATVLVSNNVSGTRTLGNWRSMGEMITLAVGSREPPDGSLDNTSAGVARLETWGIMVRVRDCAVREYATRRMNAKRSPSPDGQDTSKDRGEEVAEEDLELEWEVETTMRDPEPEPELGPEREKRRLQLVFGAPLSHLNAEVEDELAVAVGKKYN